MKKLLLILALAGFCALPVSAQKPIPHSVKMARKVAQRTEIILPQVKGYNCYKGDFHIHTTYSDGQLSPAARVVEAWLDGLDIMAITDHYDSHKGVRNMLNILSTQDSVTINTKGARVSHNGIHEEAVARLQKSGYPMLLIKGGELTRSSKNVGHFNLLFLSDIDAAFDKDPAETLRKAKAQGGIVIHNHPAWRRETSDKTEFHELAYGEGLVDGVEVINSQTFYPHIVRRCVNEGLAMFANTDEHNLTEARYGSAGWFRTMTIVLAKELTEEAVKEAILQRRTIAYSSGTLVGEEIWLNEFLNAAVDFRLTKEEDGKRVYRMTNTSSIKFTMRIGKTVYELEPFKSEMVSISADKETKQPRTPIFSVDNMWHIDYKHPKIELTIDE